MKKMILTTAITLAMFIAAGIQSTVHAEVIYGCYQKNHGQLRIVSDANECLNSEIPITLGQSLDTNDENLWPKVSGEICWNVVWENRPNYTMKLRVTNMGDGYYIVQSDMKNNVTGNHFGAWFGHAQLVGNEYRISVHETHSDSQPYPAENADNLGCQWFLDSTDLNGTGWCSTGHDNDEYSTGTLTYTTCE